MKLRHFIFSILISSTTAAFIPTDRNITCPGDAGHDWRDTKSGKVFTIECSITRGGVELAKGGPRDRPEAHAANVCIGACARIPACIYMEWDELTWSCAMRSSYDGLSTGSLGTIAASLKVDDVGTGEPVHNMTISTSWITSTTISPVTQTRTHTEVEHDGAAPVSNAFSTRLEPQEVTVTVTASYFEPKSTLVTLAPLTTLSSSVPQLVTPSMPLTPTTGQQRVAASTSSSSPRPSNQFEPASLRISKGKRGLLYNDAKFMQNFGGEGSKVTWAANWHSDRYTDEHGVQASFGQYNEALEYVPQLWNISSEAAFSRNVKIFKRRADVTTHLLSFNEPNQCGGGGTCMANRIDDLVASYMKLLQPHARTARLGSPSVTNGPDGISWLEDFMQQCSQCKIDFVQAHWYGGGMADFRPYIEKFHSAFPDKPIWLTEFAIDGATVEEQIEFLRQAMDFLDEAEYVERYAFFMAKPLADSRALVNEDGSLTEVGKLYNSH